MTRAKNLEDLQNRWSFMCEGIEDDSIRNATMMVLENSANYMVENEFTTEDVMSEILDEAEGNPNVSQADYQGAIGGDTPRKGVANYVVPKVMLPVIRRVMPQLIAHELVSVQPIQGKTGVIFYAEYQYSDGKGGVTAGQAFTGNYPQDTAAGANLAGQAFYSSQKLGPYTVTGTGATAVSITEPFAKTTMTYLGAEIYPVAGGKAISGTVEVTADGTIAVTAAEALTDSTDYTVFVKYQQEASAAIPEMQFQIMSKSVETVERKLKVRFTREAMQDLKAHFNLDLDSELVKMASVEMNYEIDREIISFIDKNVPTQLSYSHNWDFNGTNPVYNYLDRHRALAQSIFTLAGKMAQYNRQGAANWAVVSPKVAAVLQMLPEFTKETVVTSPNIYTIGSMSKIKYFVDPNRVGADEDTILLGFKSPISTFGAGVVYSPYANWMTPSIFDPNTFDSNKGFFSRYSLTLAPRGEWFYAKLTITNLK
jgi:hypothetical protein